MAKLYWERRFFTTEIKKNDDNTFTLLLTPKSRWHRYGFIALMIFEVIFDKIKGMFTNGNKKEK